MPEMAAWRTTSNRRPRFDMGLGWALVFSSGGAGQCPFRLIVGAALSHRAAEGHVDIDPMNPPLDFTAWLLQLECSWNAVRAHVPVTHMQPFFAAVGH